MPLLGIESTIQVCALTRNQTFNLLVYRMTLQPTEPPSQGKFLKIKRRALDGVAQVVGALSCKSKVSRFDSQSGHLPRLQVQSLTGCVQEATDWSFSHRCPSFSRPSLPLSLKSVNMSLGEDKKEGRREGREGKRKERRERGREERKEKKKMLVRSASCPVYLLLKFTLCSLDVFG